jgi:hypothetical protein
MFPLATLSNITGQIGGAGAALYYFGPHKIISGRQKLIRCVAAYCKKISFKFF